MKTNCVKARYKSRYKAQERLEIIELTSKRGKIPTRVYYCWHCHGFHLTSEPYEHEKPENNPINKTLKQRSK